MLPLGDVIRKWFHFYLDNCYIDRVGCNLYHPFGVGRSCVDVVADHSVYLSEEEGVSSLSTYGWCYIRWSGRVASQLPRPSQQRLWRFWVSAPSALL